MSLMFHRPPAEDGPGCHALIAGVSAYRHLESPTAKMIGLQPLTCAAGSAHHIYQWLRTATLAVPLASARLLLSPGASEAVDPHAGPCTLDNFIRDAYEWRQEASGHRDNITFFYFAGHGFSLSAGEQLLVLQEFGDGIGPLLRNAVSLNNLVYGMSPGAGGPEIARTQLYFVDAGRRRHSALADYQAVNSTAVFDAPMQGIDDRTAPIFYATSPDAATYGFPDQLTLFSRALIDGLDGAAAVTTDDGRWGVSVLSLAKYLPVRVHELAAEGFATQHVGVEGSLRDSMISYLDGPPEAEVTVSIDPAELRQSATVQMFDFDGLEVAEWKKSGDEFKAIVPAGLYQLEVSGDRSGTPYRKRKLLDVRPPRRAVNVRF